MNDPALDAAAIALHGLLVRKWYAESERKAWVYESAAVQREYRHLARTAVEAWQRAGAVTDGADGTDEADLDS